MQVITSHPWLLGGQIYPTDAVVTSYIMHLCAPEESGCFIKSVACLADSGQGLRAAQLWLLAETMLLKQVAATPPPNGSSEKGLSKQQHLLWLSVLVVSSTPVNDECCLKLHMDKSRRWVAEGLPGMKPASCGPNSADANSSKRRVMLDKLLREFVFGPSLLQSGASRI